MRYFAGGYSPDMDGRADGIGVLHAGEADSALAGVSLSRHPDAVATGGSPSWLGWHPTLDVLYAALEGTGAVQAFRRTGPESLAALGAPAAVGDLPCHVAVEPGGRWLIVTCWGDGRVVRVGLDPGGVPRRTTAGRSMSDSGAAGADPDADVVAAGLRALLAHLPDTGESADADAERAGLLTSLSPSDSSAPDALPPSRAHQACFLPGGAVATTDLGRDAVRFWQANAEGLRETDRVALPPGTGPRHAVWHPSGHLYVVTEASLEVFVLAPPVGGAGSGRRGWRLVGGASLSPAAMPGDAAAEIALSRGADFVYAGVRGSNTIATLRVGGTGAQITPVALVDAGVDWPRHHVVARDTLLVAGQRSDEVASLTLDLRTGVPGRVRQRVEMPSPTMLLADRADRADRG